MISQRISTRQGPRPDVPHHVRHDSFDAPDAESAYGPDGAPADDFEGSYMPDEVTRDLARRMHYAAWRASSAPGGRARSYWLGAYRGLRDRIVLGNRKLIYRAVQRWSPPQPVAEDTAGDCQVVLIQAVAAYNPFLGVRFSTYAFTCLMRALSRLSQRRASDRLASWQPLGDLPDGAIAAEREGPTSPALTSLDHYLREGDDLLSFREKRILRSRFNLDGKQCSRTLEQVGQELDLSKERVRQLQASAIEKLRRALLPRPG